MHTFRLSLALAGALLAVAALSLALGAQARPLSAAPPAAAVVTEQPSPLRAAPSTALPLLRGRAARRAALLQARRAAHGGIADLPADNAPDSVAALGACSFTAQFNKCFTQATLGVDASEQEDYFGDALAYGDFNGDGFDDLAIGSWGDDVGSAHEAGYVHVLYATSQGITLTGQRWLDQSDVGDTAEVNDQFGFALATGDFNGDGFDDLAIGSPGEDIPGCFGQCDAAGMVHVIYGKNSGLDLTQIQKFWQTHGVPTCDLGRCALKDDYNFGYALAAGDFNADGADDLVIGVPGADDESVIRDKVGAKWVIYGDANKLGNSPLPSNAFQAPTNSNARQGSSFAVGNFDDFAKFGPGAYDDLAVGTPGRGINNGQNSGLEADAGDVFILFGSSSGITATDQEFFAANYLFSNIPVQAGARFGDALAMGDLNRDGFDDLAIGEPGRDITVGNTLVPNAGRVYVFLGGPHDTLYPRENELLDQNNLLSVTNQINTNDRTGAELAMGDLNGDGFAELVVGAPGDSGYGRVLYAYGGDSFNNSSPIDINSGNRTGTFFQTTIGTPANVAGDNFGSVLAIGDSNGDGQGEIGIGVPLRDGAFTDVGIVYVLQVPAPKLTGINPPKWPARVPLGNIVLTGTGLLSVSDTFFNGKLHSAVITSSTLMRTSGFACGSDSMQGVTMTVTAFDPTGPLTTLSPPIPFFITNPTPSLVSIFPLSVVAGGPTFTLRFTGTGLVELTEVRWNNVLVDDVNLGGTSCYPLGFPDSKTVKVLPAFFANSGQFAITLFNPPPGSGPSNPITITVLPAIKTFLPLVVR